MLIPQGTTIAIADGEKLNLYETTSPDAVLLKALPEAHPAKESAGSGSRHHNSSGNPSAGQLKEDDFAASIADMLNQRVSSGRIQHLFVVAAPKTLGEMRKHYSKQVSSLLIGELAKDLTGQSISEIEKILSNAA